MNPLKDKSRVNGSQNSRQENQVTQNRACQVEDFGNHDRDKSERKTIKTSRLRSSTMNAGNLRDLVISVGCAYKTTTLSRDEADLFYFLYTKSCFVPDGKVGRISLDSANDCTVQSEEQLRAAWESLVSRNVLCSKNGENGQVYWYINEDYGTWK